MVTSLAFGADSRKVTLLSVWISGEAKAGAPINTGGVCFGFGACWASTIDEEISAKEHKQNAILSGKTLLSAMNKPSFSPFVDLLTFDA